MTDSFSHIIERPITPIGVTAAGGTSFINQSNSYDCALGGLPFFFGISDKYPYKRETAQYRKQQIDQQKEPGEQTLTGWWLRSQSSFHYGAGIRFQEPVQGETVPYRFNKSAGVDVFNTGRVDLLPDVSLLKASTSTTIDVEGFTDAGTDYALISDGTNVFRVDASGTSTTITWGGSHTILDIAHDGIYYYIADTVGIFKGPLSLSGSGASIFTHPTVMTGTVTSVKMNWVKQRLIAGVNNYLFEVTPVTSYTVVAGYLASNLATLTTATSHNLGVGSQVVVASISAAYNGVYQVTAVPAANQFSYQRTNTDVAYATGMTGTAALNVNNNLPVYSHSNPSWVWTGVVEGPNAIYVSGWSGDCSTVFRLSLDITGAVPLLSKAVTAADLPRGEIVLSLGSYVGKYMVFGTNKGIRVGQIDTSGFVSSGYITYGPLTVVTSGYDPGSGTTLAPSSTDANVNYVTFNDRYAYCTVSNYIDNGDGTFSSGLVKIDLGKEISTNQVAYATHLRAPSTNTATDAAVFGHSNRLMMAISGKGVYIQSMTALCTSGYIQTGYIRMLTLEDKHFKLIKPRMQLPVTGDVKLSSVDATGSVVDLFTVTPAYDITQDITTGSIGPAESIAFRFTLTPNGANSTTFNGYQLKSLPAVRRQRSYSVPLLNFDFEGDRFNMTTGYEGRAVERLQALEDIEAQGDVIIYQDFTTGETIQGVIDSLSFVRMTPPERRFSGFGGVVYAIIRSI